jgi:TolB-like protein/DNA-binding SARP family transcriptional activator
MGVVSGVEVPRQIEIQVLGSLRVAVDGVARPLPKSRKARALLALLVLEPAGCSRTMLCNWLWPDVADPRAALRWGLSTLRNQLDARPAKSAIVSSGERITLDWQKVTTDRARVVHVLERGEATPLESLLAIEQEFQSGPLVDLDGRALPEVGMWLATQQEAHDRLHRRVLAALLLRLCEQPSVALPLARKQVGLDPLNSAANLRLVELTLAQHGRRAAQSILEAARTRFRDAGMSDSELIAGWRRLAPPTTPQRTHPQTQNTAAAEQFPALPQRPSVAVLGFDDLGGHERGAHLAEGLAADINSRLATLQELFVVSRASAQQYSLRSAHASQVGRALGVRYLVHGATQRTEKRMRVTVDLIEAASAQTLWSEHFDRPLDDLFMVQDDVTNAVAAAIQPQIDRAEMDRSRRLPTENLDAWECFHRAMWHSFRFTQEDNVRAADLFRRALSQDPQFSRAFAGLSFNHFSRAFLDTSDDVAGDIHQALELATISVGLDGRDALGYWSLGRALFLARRHDEALSALDRSLLANANSALGYYARGFVATHSGVPGQAIGDLDMAQRLSPFDPLTFAIKSSRAIALLLDGRHDAAADWALRATQEPNAHFHIFAIAAACQQLIGRHQEAQRALDVVLSRHPRYSAKVFETSFPHKSDDHRRLLHNALLRAGLPG